MSKLILLLAVASLGCKLLTGRWPWQFILQPSRSAAEQHARALLGVARLASREENNEAHRRLITQVHPDRGGTAGQVHEANAARDLLLGQLTPGKS